jgi:hypothetical protein
MTLPKDTTGKIWNQQTKNLHSYIIQRRAHVALPARTAIGRRPVDVRVDVGATLVAAEHAQLMMRRSDDVGWRDGG